MPFDREEANELLVNCHRRCCICHRFCGTKIELDHIEPRANTQDDRIENAIAVCFECHAEIHSYNDQHPRGRKFRPEELRRHRDQWLEICNTRPEALLAAAWDRDVGPLQALVDELEFNRTVAASQRRGALFESTQFRRAVHEGMVAILDTQLRDAILMAYSAMSRANQHVLAEVNQDVRMLGWGAAAENARQSVAEASPLVDAAHQHLMRFVAREAG